MSFLSRTLRHLVALAALFLLSATIKGKQRCFSIVVAYLYNSTACEAERPTACAIHTLNWINDLAPGVTSVATAVLLYCTHSISEDGTAFVSRGNRAPSARRLAQSILLLSLGCILSVFCTTKERYEPLLLTDSLIQGFGAAVMVSFVVVKMTSHFPPGHAYNTLTTFLSEGAPWGSVFLCPFMAFILTSKGHWQFLYLILASILVAECLLVGYLSRELDAIDDPLGPEKNDGKNSPESIVEMPTMQETLSMPPPPQPAPLFTLRLLTTHRPSRTAWLWCLERGLFHMVMWNLFVNVEIYLVGEMGNSLVLSSFVFVSFAGGEILGLMVVLLLGGAFGLRRPLRMLKLNLVSAVIMAAILVSWQLVHVYEYEDYDTFNVHAMMFVIGGLATLSNVHNLEQGSFLTGFAVPVVQFLLFLAQGAGLLLAPLTSGLLIQFDDFHTFFLVQSGVNLIRVALLVLMYQYTVDRDALGLSTLSLNKSRTPLPSVSYSIPECPEEEEAAAAEDSNMATDAHGNEESV